MASQAKIAETVTFDWHRKLQTSHETPRKAVVLGDCPLSGHKRVVIRGDFETKMLRTNPQSEAATTWHYHQDGKPVGGYSPEWLLVEAY